MQHIRPACSACVFWELDHTASTETAGHCHRFPPGIYVNPQTGVVVQKFPSTDRHHWCGEWDGDHARFSAAVREALVKTAQTRPAS